MKEILTVKMNLDDYSEPKIYFLPDPNNDIDCRALDDDNKDAFIKIVGCSPQLADALINFQYEIKESLFAIKKDMTELYKEIKTLKEGK